MANIVRYDRRPDLEPIQMSNGLTSVFIAVLALAASRLARTNHEKELAAWIGSRDQSVFGLGVVGFNIGEIPWAAETLDQDKAFLLRAIQAAEARTGWDGLDYVPGEDSLTPSLDKFGELVAAFCAEDIVRTQERSWPWGKPETLTLCEKHGVY